MATGGYRLNNALTLAGMKVGYSYQSYSPLTEYFRCLFSVLKSEGRGKSKATIHV